MRCALYDVQCAMCDVRRCSEVAAAQEQCSFLVLTLLLLLCRPPVTLGGETTCYFLARCSDIGRIACIEQPLWDLRSTGMPFSVEFALVCR